MKKYISSLLFVVLVNAAYSQALIFPKLPSDPINDLYFLNNNEIIFVNDGGCIYKSYDAGNTWVRKSYFSGIHLNQINFVNNNTGFVITAYNDDLVYTNDGGDSWHKQQLTLSDAIAALPFSERIIIKSTFDGNILRLDNFYNKWDTVFQTATYRDSSIIINRLGKANRNNFFNFPYGSINKFHKLPNGNVLALGDNRNAFNHHIKHDSLSYILMSKDSCLSWDTLWIGLQQFVKDFYFADNKTGWMISDTSLFKSSDSGLTWILQNTGGVNYYTSLFAKGENIYLVTADKFIKSTDLGNTWNIGDFNVTGISSIIFNDNNYGFILGNGLYKTIDAGNTWENLNPYSQNDIYDMHFISLRVGIALGNRGVYKTYDGGNSWFTKFIPGGLISNNPGMLGMLNDSVGWLISYNNIYKTEDGGEQWNNISFYNKDLIFNQIALYNEKLGIITAAEESISGSHIYDIENSFITTDGGKNWNKRSSTSKNFDKLKFTDKDHLWGINQSGLWVSYDTSASWKKIYGGDYFIGSWSFDFSDSLYGVVTSSYDQAFLTTNGGNSWTAFNKPIGNHPTDCRILGQYISGSQRILETGSDGKILLTYIYPNGVIDFSYQETSFTGMKLNKIDVFIDNDFPCVWVGGNGSSIWYRQFEKIATDVKRNNPPPSSFVLSQNYPNPFNPSTIITFALPTKSFVTLKIFDILGREITTLISKELSAGNHELEWNATGFVSGVYFYRLQAGSFTATKKLLLLK
jgi:Uncharacterized protein related to plant photosystem II stability/assembly factor